MARKRKSSEVEPQAEASIDMANASNVTQYNADDMRRQFQELCRAARLKTADDSSIPGRQDKIDKSWSAYQFLFLKNPSQLQREVDKIKATIANEPSVYFQYGARVDLLLECLKNGAIATPKTERFTKRSKSSEGLPTIPEPTQPCSTNEYLQDQPSPTPKSTKKNVNTDLKSTFKISKARAGKSPSAAKPATRSPTREDGGHEHRDGELGSRDRSADTPPSHTAQLPNQPDSISSRRLFTKVDSMRIQRGADANELTNALTHSRDGQHVSQTEEVERAMRLGREKLDRSGRGTVMVCEKDSPPTTPSKSATISATKHMKQTTLQFGLVPKPPVFKTPALPEPLIQSSASKLSAYGNTSFTSTAANTSFGQNISSCFSQDTQRSVQTDATSVSDMASPARPAPRESIQSTDYGSWPFDNAIEKLPEDPLIAPPSPTKHITSRRRRALNALPQNSDSGYGSEFGASTLDELDKYRIKHAGEMDYEVSPELPAIQDVVPVQGSPKRQPLTPVMQFEPTSSFAQLKLPKDFDDLPFTVLWEAQRLLQTGHLSSAELASRWRRRSLQTLYGLAANLGKPFQRGFNTEDIVDLDLKNVTFSAELQYAQSSSGPIFDLVLQPPKTDKSCDLQRRYGAERVLYVDIPSMSKPPLVHQGRSIMARFSEMASQPQCFLGQRWILYVVQPNKKTKNSAVSGSNRLVFFAINDEPVRSLFDNIIPYRENSRQPARKLYTRLELFLSRTDATLEFLPEDVDFNADDQFATRHPDDNSFLDPRLQRVKQDVDPEENFDEGKEMSDGCAMLSSWAYWQVHKALGMENLRAAFQARIGGAKGVWYKDREDFTGMDEKKPPGKHIKLAKSQVKVKRDTLAGCDPFTLTLNVVKYNAYATTSLLHSGFMPILLDRGVPRQVMLDVIRTQVRREMEEFENAVKGGPQTLRRWISSQNGIFEEKNREREIQLRPDGLPLSREERIVQLLEAGFDPHELPYLAREVTLMAQQAFDLKRKNYKIKLGRSTTLMGIADPFGCLEPGEVHVNFSTPFLDANGMSWLRLNMDGLIARNPALAPWDIQKVKFVCKPELEHLPDLFIFPTKGRRPLAGMLQGGDYDGDTFWGCWEPKFTHFFTNAPCPWEAPKEELFNIKKRTETLQHYVQDPDSESEWCRWLGEMATARLGMNLLGVVTKLHERLVYRDGDLKSDQALALVHLHDYLVDADKQGYEFGFDDLNQFRKDISLPTNLPDPAYWELLKGDNSWNDYENEPDNYPVDTTKVTDNIIDEAYFGVVQPTITESLERVTAMLSIKEKEDADLTKLWQQMLDDSKSQPIIAKALRELKVDLEQVRKVWGMNYKKYKFDELIELVRDEYDKVKPHDLHEDRIKEWLRRCGNDLSTWDKLKASALARFQHHAEKPGKFIFSIAGGELCRLKLSEMGASRGICMDQYRMLKLRKERKVKLRDDYASDHGEELEDEDGYVDTGYY